MDRLINTGDRILTAPHHDRPFIYDARYRQSRQAKPVVVFIHGFKGFKDWGTFNLIADEFARQDFVFIKLNLSHNGTTPEHPHDFVDLEAFGHNNFITELEDLGALLNHLEGGESDIDPAEMDLNRLALIGHSRGGGLVLLKAAEEPRVKAVVTWAAINNLEQRWPQSFLDEWKEKGVAHIPNARTGQQMPLYYQLVENFKENKERLDIPTAVNRLQQPLLVIHGTGDETLPSTMAHELASWKKGSELLILPKASHTFGGAHPWQSRELPEDTVTAVSASITFLKKALGAAQE
jgi:uncharacterized protein